MPLPSVSFTKGALGVGGPNTDLDWEGQAWGRKRRLSRHFLYGVIVTN